MSEFAFDHVAFDTAPKELRGMRIDSELRTAQVVRDLPRPVITELFVIQRLVRKGTPERVLRSPEFADVREELTTHFLDRNAAVPLGVSSSRRSSAMARAAVHAIQLTFIDERRRHTFKSDNACYQAVADRLKIDRHRVRRAVKPMLLRLGSASPKEQELIFLALLMLADHLFVRKPPSETGFQRTNVATKLGLR